MMVMINEGFRACETRRCLTKGNADAGKAATQSRLSPGVANAALRPRLIPSNHDQPIEADGAADLEAQE